MNLRIGPVMLDLIELILVASCVNLCSNLSLAVEEIGLSVPLINAKI